MTFGQTLTISIIAAIITGFFAVLGVVLTIRQNNKQLKAQMKIHQEEQQQKIIDLRPEFDIVSFKIFETENIIQEPMHSDINFLYYPKDIEEKDILNKWKVHKYCLKNIGQQSIEYIDIFSLHDNILLYQAMEDGKLSLSILDLIEQTGNIAYYKNRISNGQTITLSIYVPIEHKITNFPRVSCCLVSKSFDKRLWRQNFYIGEKTIEEANFITSNEYKDLINRSLYKE